MELIITLLKELASTLSPTEFMVVLIVILGAIFFVIRYIINNASVSGSIVNRILHKNDDFRKHLDEKIPRDILTVSDLEKNLKSLKETIDDHIAKTESDFEIQKTRSVQILESKDKIFDALKRLEYTCNELQKQINHKDDLIDERMQRLNSDLTRLHDSVNRVMNQIEKNEDSIRYLTSDVKDLSKDIALVDSHIQSGLVNLSPRSGVNLK